jgi:hypothetical protein
MSQKSISWVDISCGLKCRIVVLWVDDSSRHQPGPMVELQEIETIKENMQYIMYKCTVPNKICFYTVLEYSIFFRYVYSIGHKKKCHVAKISSAFSKRLDGFKWVLKLFVAVYHSSIHLVWDCKEKSEHLFTFSHHCFVYQNNLFQHPIRCPRTRNSVGS